MTALARVPWAHRTAPVAPESVKPDLRLDVASRFIARGEGSVYGAGVRGLIHIVSLDHTELKEGHVACAATI